MKKETIETLFAVAVGGAAGLAAVWFWECSPPFVRAHLVLGGRSAGHGGDARSLEGFLKNEK